ncbi:adventurous-gliding motility protein Z-like [Hyalella azteca]|uniref:Adventurous-gliding motility protein Z-like n=1 Tax=Hyalella azteca TaxID=294128 RepID=A0A979FWE0_HYAAZ|nr:adventurous-gliding motility protein Z-like [Hyalella azteca]
MVESIKKKCPTAQLAEAQREDEFREHLLQQQRRQQLRQQRQQQKTGQEDSSAVHPKFLDKIDRLVGGRQTGKQAAKSIVVDNDRTFGFVRSELKKDKRTIEQTLADIRAKKMKREHDSAIATSGNPALTSGSHTQTSGNLAQTSGNPAQTSGRNALTSGNLAQTSGKTAQTSGSHAQTSGSHAHTSGNHAQISGNLARTSGSPASMSHNAIRTGSNSLNEAHVLSSCRKDSSNHQ